MLDELKNYTLTNKVKMSLTMASNFIDNLETVTSEMKDELISKINANKAYCEENLSEHKKTQKAVYDYLNSDESIENRNKIINTKMYHDPNKLEAKKAMTDASESIVKSLSNSVALKNINFEDLNMINYKIMITETCNRTVEKTALYYTEIFCDDYKLLTKEVVKQKLLEVCHSMFSLFVNLLKNPSIEHKELKYLMEYEKDEEMRKLIFYTNKSQIALEKSSKFDLFVKEQEKKYEQFKNEKIKEMQDIRYNVEKYVSDCTLI